MSFTAEPDELSAAYRPLRFTYEETSSEDVESVKVEVLIYGNTEVTYRKPYAVKAGNDYTFYIDVQSPVQRYLAPRTDYTAATTIFPSASGYSATNSVDAYATYAVKTYLEYRSSAGLLVTSSASTTSSTLYAYAARRPAADVTMNDYYQQTTATKFNWLTDGPTAQDIGVNEAAALCAAHKGWQYLILKFYQGGALTSSATSNTLDAGANPTMLSIDAGPANLVGAGGMPTDFNTIDYYTVELGTAGGTAYSNPWRFDIVGRCSHAKRMYWMNSVGGVDQYTFEGQITKIHTHSGDIREINQPIPTDSDLPGLIKTGITSQVKYRIVEPMDAEDAEWVRNLFISPEVYMEIDGSLWRVAIEPGENEIDVSNEIRVELDFLVLVENEITQEA